jgi:hypothetical protein
MSKYKILWTQKLQEFSGHLNKNVKIIVYAHYELFSSDNNGFYPFQGRLVCSGQALSTRHHAVVARFTFLPDGLTYHVSYFLE